MLALYVDDSRRKRAIPALPGEHETHAIAGYIAPVNLWEDEFVPRWKRMLREDFARPVREFKAADAGGAYGEFRYWSDAERGRMIRRVVDEVVDERYRGMFGVGAVMIIPRSAEHDGATNDMMADRALEAALHETILAACDAARNVWGPEPIHVFCDPQPGLMGRLQRVWDLLRPAVMESYGASISRLDFTRHSHELEPLQAADLWAYELRADLEHRLEVPPRNMNMSLRRLLGGPPHVSFYYDAQTYLDRHDAAEAGAYRPPPLLCVSPHVDIADGGYMIIDDDRPGTPDLPLRRRGLEP